MSHTLQISESWIAIYDQDPSDDSIIQFKKYNGELLLSTHFVPYGIIKDFIAEIIRQKQIVCLENKTSNEILNL